MQTFYFTYSTEGQPYYGGWTEVVAENQGQAVSAYTVFNPLRNGLLPCSTVYDEEEFKKTLMYKYGNFGCRCHERITVDKDSNGRYCINRICGEV